MKKIVLTFGLLSGAVSSVLMFGTVSFIDGIGFDRGVVVGYTAIVLSLLFVFFGVRAYREHLGDRPLTFTGAFTAGILITLISCVFYVVSWEIVSANFFPDFIDKYVAHTIDSMRAQGATQEAIAATEKQMAEFKESYASLPVRMAYTFIEPFPVGLVMTLIAAFTLRSRPAKG